MCVCVDNESVILRRNLEVSETHFNTVQRRQTLLVQSANLDDIVKVPGKLLYEAALAVSHDFHRFFGMKQ